MAQSPEDAYCTLLMSDSYLPGAAVLAHSLRDAGTKKKLAVLVTLDTLSADTVAQLKTLYDYVIPVERIRNPNLTNLYLMGRPDLAFTFTKVALWRQTQFRKIVYLDADVVALRNLDELFDIEAPFAAAPDIGWPDAFNTGVMVLTPGMGEYWNLQTMAATGDSFDGADQGLLNQYFEHRPWQRLKFTYNCTPSAEYQWEPAYRHYKRDISAVHFIGKEKPWSERRSGGSGVYGSLLARWWAVHDRHLREETGTDQQNGVAEPEAPVITSETPMSDPGEMVENINQGVIEPTPPVEQRNFSAPEMAWDATKSQPPSQSRPEAANFPHQQYSFSASKNLFKPPQAYPEPPKDMWYKVPDSRPQSQQPKPIFPWERENDRPKPTRVFADDVPPEPTPASPTHPFSTVHYETNDRVTPEASHDGVTSPGRPLSAKSADEGWQAFQHSNGNAWDNVPGIENYVRNVMESHGKRNKIQSLKQTTGTEDLESPLLDRRNRRESLILTDFPTAVERPSLPVTPAPIRRPSFWGDERDRPGDLPGAEGVEDQAQWNPDAKLEQLRRSSLVEIEHLKNDQHPNPPLRALPEHSVMTDEDSHESHAPLSGGASPHGIAESSEKADEQPSAREVSTEQLTAVAPAAPSAPDGPFEGENKMVKEPSPEVSEKRSASVVNAPPMTQSRPSEPDTLSTKDPSSEVAKQQPASAPEPAEKHNEKPTEAEQDTVKDANVAAVPKDGHDGMGKDSTMETSSLSQTAPTTSKDAEEEDLQANKQSSHEATKEQPTSTSSAQPTTSKDAVEKDPEQDEQSSSHEAPKEQPTSAASALPTVPGAFEDEEAQEEKQHAPKVSDEQPASAPSAASKPAAEKDLQPTQHSSTSEASKGKPSSAEPAPSSALKDTANVDTKPDEESVTSEASKEQPKSAASGPPAASNKSAEENLKQDDESVAPDVPNQQPSSSASGPSIASDTPAKTPRLPDDKSPAPEESNKQPTSAAAPQKVAPNGSSEQNSTPDPQPSEPETVSDKLSSAVSAPFKALGSLLGVGSQTNDGPSPIEEFRNQDHLSAEDLRLRVGKTLFSLPDFGQEKSESGARDTVVNQTQSHDEFPIPGRFS